MTTARNELGHPAGRVLQKGFCDPICLVRDEAGPDIARRFQIALDQTLNKLASRPDLGRLRNFGNPRLQGLRSFLVERPFNKILIFYRVEKDVLHAVRLMHGARDLPRRLAQPPAME